MRQRAWRTTSVRLTCQACQALKRSTDAVVLAAVAERSEALTSSVSISYSSLGGVVMLCYSARGSFCGIHRIRFEVRTSQNTRIHIDPHSKSAAFLILIMLRSRSGCGKFRRVSCTRSGGREGKIWELYTSFVQYALQFGKVRRSKTRDLWNPKSAKNRNEDTKTSQNEQDPIQ